MEDGPCQESISGVGGNIWEFPNFTADKLNAGTKLPNPDTDEGEMTPEGLEFWDNIWIGESGASCHSCNSDEELLTLRRFLKALQ